MSDLWLYYTVLVDNDIGWVIQSLNIKPIFTIAAHPWLCNDSGPIPLDVLIYKLVKSYLHATPFKRAALKVLFLAFPNT
jgi:hypothetical protein